MYNDTYNITCQIAYTYVIGQPLAITGQSFFLPNCSPAPVWRLQKYPRRYALAMVRPGALCPHLDTPLANARVSVGRETGPHVPAARPPYHLLVTPTFIHRSVRNYILPITPLPVGHHAVAAAQYTGHAGSVWARRAILSFTDGMGITGGRDYRLRDSVNS